MPIQLSFDSSMSINYVLVTRILQEECGLRDRQISLHRREKRSYAAPGNYNLQKYFLDFYQKTKNILNHEHLKGMKKIADHLNHIKPLMKNGKFSDSDKFFAQMWRDIEEARNDSNDEHFDLILEQTLRTSLQLLIQNEELSDILLYHPIVLDMIKRRIPISNGKLLSEVKVSNVKCHQLHRDSQVVLLMKLKIPIIEKKTIDKCDDIGRISHNTYQYYALPTATFKRDGHVFKVDMKQCIFENFIFCPPNAIRPTDCSKENVERCPLEKRTSAIRELQLGFAVYGDYTHVITTKDDIPSQWFIHPYLLYHIIPKSGETVSIGKEELKQRSQSRITVINQI